MTMLRRLTRAASSVGNQVASSAHRVSARLGRTDRSEGPLPSVRCRPVTNPVLPVSDIATAVPFYEALGFTVECYDDGYAWVKHGGWEYLHLERSDDAGGGSAYLHVDDPDRWHVAFTANAGGASIGEVTDQPWSMREFAVVDPDGNRIRFGANI